MSALTRFILALAILSRTAPARAEDPPPNVILMTLDTLRADHLGCYGYERPTSPFIDDFATSATFFPVAHSSSPWTLPSHASLFTGRHSFEHGARTHKVGERYLRPPMPEEAVMITEVFKAEGYRTGAFTANIAYLHPSKKINQGFDKYFNGNQDAGVLTTLALEWIQESPEDPFFLFLNFMDTHTPYKTNKKPGDPGFIKNEADRHNDKALKGLHPIILERREPFPADRIRIMIDMYDTAIWNLDGYLRTFIHTLIERNLYDNTLIVLTSDHGESFGEHAILEHGKDVYRQLLDVPLIIKYPGQTEGTVDNRVTTSSDIPRMIFKRMPEGMWNKYLDLFPFEPGNHPPISENYYAFPHEFVPGYDWKKRFNRIRTVLFDPPMKYIHSSDGQHEVYNMKTDPAESDNLYESSAERVAEWNRRIEELKASAEAGSEAPAEEEPMTDEERKRLQSLGYIN